MFDYRKCCNGVEFFALGRHFLTKAVTRVSILSKRQTQLVNVETDILVSRNIICKLTRSATYVEDAADNIWSCSLDAL